MSISVIENVVTKQHSMSDFAIGVQVIVFSFSVLASRLKKAFEVDQYEEGEENRKNNRCP